MRIREIAIHHYGPLRDVIHQPNPGLQVFYGPNESGKTLLMDAMLKLMLGANLQDFKNIDRVPGLPQGRVVMAHQGQESILDGNSCLEQNLGLNSSDLRNIFVIRNKDLQMANQAKYLSRVSDKLTGMEGERLTQLKDILRKRGRLTNPTSSAKLSKAMDFNKIGEHVENAQALAQEIEEYLEYARSNRLDKQERRLEEARRRLNSINQQIQEQEKAEQWQDHTELCQLVEDYEKRAKAAYNLRHYTQKTFIKLQDLESRGQAALDLVRTNKEKQAQLQPRLEKAQGQLLESQASLTPLEERKPQLDQLEQQTLMAAGNPPPPEVGAYTRFGYGLLAVAGIGLLLAALGNLPPLLLLVPVVALVGAIFFFIADRNAITKAQEYRNRDKTLLQKGAATGIIAQTKQELAAAVAHEKTDLETARARHKQLTDTVRSLEQNQEHLETEIQEKQSEANNLQQELKQELQSLGIETLEQMGKMMDKYTQAQNSCNHLHQRLEAKFGQTPARTGNWRDLLQQVEIPDDPGAAFDRDKLSRLRREKDRIQSEINIAQEKLHDHLANLNRFSSACFALPLEDELGCELPPLLANLEVLTHACSLLRQFASAVQNRCETALALLTMVEDVELEEQEKMADLVGPHRPVQKIFRSITQGRYTGVVLDSDLNLQVHNQDNIKLPASALSQGTYDQLYLALRLSLAQELLAGEPGFLLLDDAFLCADSQRLDQMLAVMAQLASEGWHILYFSMDQRLAEAVTRHTDNPIIRLSALQQ